MITRRLILKATGLAAFTAVEVLAQDNGYGHFVGSVRSEWLPDGRNMRLLADFSYVDPLDVVWLAPKNSVVDGASIPMYGWSFIGGPFEGKYREASVIHDVACNKKERPWESVHLAFYYAMLCKDVEMWRAKVMYAAVYFGGPRWPPHTTTPGVEPPSIPTPSVTTAEQFYELAALIESSETNGPARASRRAAEQYGIVEPRFYDKYPAVPPNQPYRLPMTLEAIRNYKPEP